MRRICWQWLVLHLKSKGQALLCMAWLEICPQLQVSDLVEPNLHAKAVSVQHVLNV